MPNNTAKDLFQMRMQPNIFIKSIYNNIKKDQGEEAALEKIRKFTTAMAINPAKFFCPNGAQERFINMFDQSVNTEENPSDIGTIICTFANGVGKCIPLTAPILMADGTWKALSDIVAGDIVIGHNYDTGTSEPTKVVATTRAGRKKVYRMNFTDGGYVEASNEHHFPIKIRSGRKGSGTHARKENIEYIRNRNRNTKWKGGKVKFQSPKKILFRQQKKLPIHPYVLGALLGDGGLSCGYVAVTSKDRPILDRISDIVYNDEYELRHVDKITYAIAKRKIENRTKLNKYITALKKLRLMGKKSHNKFIPQIYKTASVEEREQLIAGMIDTDGCEKEYVSKSHTLANDFCEVVKSLGGRAIIKNKVVNNSYTHYKDKLYYRVYWKFERLLPLTLKYKQSISKGQREYSNRVLDTVEYLGERECGDIQVEHEHHTYISYDYVSTGNTKIMEQAIINLVFGVQNKWFDKDIFKNKWTMPKRIWYCSTPSQLTKKVCPMLVEQIEKASRLSGITYKITKGHSKWTEKIEFSNGWVIYFFSYNQEASELEGDEIGLIINDEPAPERFDKAQKSRRRMGNITVHIMTPLYCDPYLANNYKKAREKDIRGIYTLEANVYEACMERGTRGHLSKIRIDRMVREYDEDEREARVNGKFMFYSTRIYNDFSRDMHTAIPMPNGFVYHGKEVEIPIGSQLKMANDPKDGIADAVGYAWLFPNGRLYVFAESPRNNDIYYWEMKKSVSPAEKVREWYEIEKSSAFPKNHEPRRLIDIIFGIEQTRGGKNLATLYFEEGEKLAKETGDKLNFIFVGSTRKKDNKGMVHYRHEQVRELLKTQPDGLPNLIISKKCKHIIQGMENYIRKHSDRQLEHTMQVDAKPVPKFSDFPDMIGFLACDGDTGSTDDSGKITKTIQEAESSGESWATNML